MRFLCLLFLLAVGVVAVLFFRENNHELTVTFLQWAITAPAALVVGVAYGLGMLTGWSVVGLLRRSFDTATDFRRREYAQVR
jgi:lipopolysaccharide assembly protein A